MDTSSPYNSSSYHYDLPQELIAQHPAAKRDESRLMVVRRDTGSITEIPFREIIELLGSEDLLVFNDTKVIPARLFGKKPTGGQVEVLLLEPAGECDEWKALVKPGRRLQVGAQIIFGEGFQCTVVGIETGGVRRVRFVYEGSFYEQLQRYGSMPLPHYIERNEGGAPDDMERYQTVYARHEGAVAAPTAGLHFTNEMLGMLEEKGVHKAMVTLHVGLGTFRPVTVEDIREHEMHTERYTVTDRAAAVLNDPPGGRRVCVGTTSCRVLESASSRDGLVVAGDGATDIFIYPGYSFKNVDCLLTNFHLPCSTLLMLVSALAGKDLIMEAYKKAVKDKFRFYSYGDAMLIL
jgi:S-adenosylmethionine:tRNA ribosyltransferase-isomerase